MTQGGGRRGKRAAASAEGSGGRKVKAPSPRPRRPRASAQAGGRGLGSGCRGGAAGQVRNRGLAPPAGPPGAGTRPPARDGPSASGPFLFRGEGRTLSNSLKLQMIFPSLCLRLGLRFRKSETWESEGHAALGPVFAVGEGSGGGEDAGGEIGCGILSRTRGCLGSRPPSGVRTLPSAPASPHRALFPASLPPAAPVAFCFCVFAGRSPSCSVEIMVLTLGESWPVLVGKRFLSLSAADGSEGGHDSWDVERVAEWPWLSGTIRAVSHTDVTKKDLKVKRLPGLGWRPFPSYLGNETAGTPPPFLKRRPESWHLI